MEVILQIKKSRGRVRVSLDNGESLNLTQAVFDEHPLQEGQELDLEAYDQWLLVREYPRALERAISCLALRACSRGEIIQKLKRSGYRPCTVEMVLYKLEREKLLDDSDFARQWVQSRAGKKLGRTRIAMELRRKGVSADDAQAALDDLDEEQEMDGAVSLAMKAWARRKSDEDPYKARQRIMAMLVRKGYNSSMASKAVRRAMEEAETEG